MPRRPRGVVLVVLGSLVAAVFPAPGRADRIVMRGGGQVKGKVVPDPDAPARVLVILERGKTPLRLEKHQVVEVKAEPGPLDEYVTRRASAPATAPAQFELGSWCADHKLADLAVNHYEAALRLDPDFAPAHERLGHVQIHGKWLRGDELREAQGLVKFKGRWVTREEKDQREKEGAHAAQTSVWVKRVRGWRDALEFGAEDRRREAEAQLMSLREPGAVKALVKVLGEDTDPMRRLLARVLGVIPGPESAAALAAGLLAEAVGDVRGTFVDELSRRKEPDAIKGLLRGLRSESPEVVNRAAWALAHLDAQDEVPALVNALVTSQTRSVMMPSSGTAGEAGGISATFGSVPPGPYAPGAPIAYNGSSVGYLTGAAVGPGSVAFGASSSPVVSIPTPFGVIGGASPYGGGVPGLPMPTQPSLSGSRGPMPRLVTFTFQNTEVLTALVKLTGQDFGYDVAAWKRWLRTSFKPQAGPVRRAPQP